MLKFFAKSIFLLTALLINVLPTFMAFYGQKHQHKYTTNKHRAAQPEFEHGHHDVSWDLIKKKHLVMPPVHIKLKMMFAISLLFGLFVNCRLLLLNWPCFRFIEANERVPVYRRHIYLQSFLI